MEEHGSGLAGGPFPAGSAVPTPVAQRRVPPFVGVLVSVGMLGAAACAAGLGGGESDLASPAPGRLLPGRMFRDCDVCPEKVVVPPGSYVMGSPEDEVGRYFNEEPRHLVRIAHSFAVGVHEVTFIEWDACVAAGGCGDYSPEDMGNVWEWTEDCWNGAARNGRNLDLPADAYLDAPADGSAWLSGACDRRVLRGGSWFNRPRSLRSANRLGNRLGQRNSTIGFRVAMTINLTELIFMGR